MYTHIHRCLLHWCVVFFFKENRMNTGKDKKGSHFFHFPARFRILHS